MARPRKTKRPVGRPKGSKNKKKSVGRKPKSATARRVVKHRRIATVKSTLRRPVNQLWTLPIEDQLRLACADALALIERIRAKAETDTLYRFDRADAGVEKRLRRLAA